MENRLKQPDNIIFVRIPKTASTSVCRALDISIDHKTAQEWRQIYSNSFDERFKFTIIRHPFDRFVSIFCYFPIFDKLCYEGVNDYLDKLSWEQIQGRPEGWLFRPQVEYIIDPANGNILVDYIGRFDKLSESWDYVRRKTGVKVSLEHKRRNFTLKPPLTQRSKDKLYEIYKEDFKLLENNHGI